jgi:hypothetical protein
MASSADCIMAARVKVDRSGSVEMVGFERGQSSQAPLSIDSRKDCREE